MKRDNLTLALGFAHELIIDNFAGGGGTSTGLEQAFGRPVDIAINHNAEALAMHAANHPHTKHLCESVWDVDPIKVTGNQPVGLVWLSPDCKHFSKAKGGKPVEKKIRGLAWVTLRWAAKCKPRVIMLENVEEFKTWGPLLVDADGNTKPNPAMKGKTFDSFIRQLRAHGYDVDWREMRGCDHDTPTIRKRFFLVARRDGIPIQWPEPTHGAPDSIGVRAGKLLPYRTAAECIDWSNPCPSIFTRKKPLADATLRRIAKGIMRYVIDAANPFIIGQGGPIYSGKPVSAHQPFGTLTTENHRAVVIPVLAATMVQTGYGEREGQSPRALDIEKPLGTVVGGAVKHAVVSAWLAKNYTGVVGSDLQDPVGTVTSVDHHSLVTALLTEHANASNQRVMPIDEPLRTICAQVKGGHFSMITSNLVKLRGTSTAAATDEPLGTVSAGGQHHAEVRAFLVKYYGSDQDPRLEEPLHTVTSKDRFGLVTIHGQDYQIVDIGLRMLAPRELFRAQGFPDTYIIGDDPAQGLTLTKSAQVRMCGNSVCPPMARALIEANFAHEREIARAA
jgi:DNA (cytosine-5)-methyltransferase 1